METFKPIQVYYLPQSLSEKVVWFLTEMNIPHELRLFKRIDGGMDLVDAEVVKEGLSGPSAVANSSFKAKHQLGRAPIVVDPNNDDYTVAESSFILEYMIENYSFFNKNLYIPDKLKDRKGYEKMKYYFHFGSGSMQPLNLLKGVHDIAVQLTPIIVSRLLKLAFNHIDGQYTCIQIKRCLQLLEDDLSKTITEFPNSSRDFAFFLNNEMSPIDIELYFCVAMSQDKLKWTEDDYPLLYKWRAHLKENANYIRSVAIATLY